MDPAQFWLYQRNSPTPLSNNTPSELHFVIRSHRHSPAFDGKGVRWNRMSECSYARHLLRRS